MDKLKALNTFIAIADAGSLTAAARVLGTSLPAVVRSLAALEVELGVRLFNRTTRRIALTEEGRRYLASCRHVLDGLAEAERALTAEAAVPRGQLTVTAPVLFGQMHVVPAVLRFLDKYRQVDVKVLLLDRVVNLLEEGVDVGVRIGKLEDSSHIALRVGSLRRQVVASPGLLRRHSVPQHPRELLGKNCLRFLGQAPSWVFHDGAKVLQLPVTGNLQCNQLAPLLEACAQGLGFGEFISYQVAPALEQKRLSVVLEDFAPPPLPLSLIYPGSQLLPARTRLFIDWMRAELAAFG